MATLRERLGEGWYQILKEEFDKVYFRKIPAILKKERAKYNIFPKSEEVFNAYKLTPYKDVKVCIIGQDPYHGAGQAHGLAFSVKDELMQNPPSLQNIFEEIERDMGFMNLEWSSDLTPWAKQGVFLLNMTLTVREGQAASHRHIGWNNFTQATIDKLNVGPPMVFMLWGNDAKLAGKYLDTDHHLVLSASHPSPLSAYRSFNGCGHFSKCNDFLTKNNRKPINWKTTL